MSTFTMRVSKQALRLFSICAALAILTNGYAFSQEKVTPWNSFKLRQWNLKHGIVSPGISSSEVRPGEAPAVSNPPPDQSDVRVFSSSNPQTENSIAVNQANPQQLMISTNGGPTSTGQTWFFTTNGGSSWTGSETSPNSVANFGDPVALFNVAGTRAYWVTLRDPGGIGFSSTTNLGTAWGSLVDADAVSSVNDDKEHAMTDLSGVYPDNVYAAWTDFTPSPAIVRVNRSTNGGTTWGGTNTSLAIGADFGQGVHLATGPAGEVYCAFANYAGGLLPESGVRLSKSTDGGATWSSAVLAFSISGIRTTSSGIAAFGGTRVNSFPSIDVDRTAGAYSGRVYITYADRSTGDADVYSRYSSDGGTTWSSAIRVNGETVANGSQQWFPSVAVDAQTGDVSIGYYSQDTTGLLTARYVGHSIDGGATWERIRVSDVRFTPASLPSPFAAGYMGDYYETSAFGANAWACWSDNRSGQFQAYVSKLQYPNRFGWAKGVVTTPASQMPGSAMSVSPLSGVLVDFVAVAQQQSSNSAADGSYKSGANIDTPATSQLFTIRAQKFGYNTYTDSITLNLSDTVTRNISMTPAAGGLLTGRVFRSDSTSVKALVQVRFAGNLVVDNLYSDSATGLFSYPLPNGTYDVTINPPSPYGTRQFPGTVVNSDTPYISCMVRAVIETSPAALTDTLGVGQSNTRDLLLTNSTSDSVPFRIYSDNALYNFSVPLPPQFDPASPSKDPDLKVEKGAEDPRFGPPGRMAKGGPDSFGYIWIDSDEPGGPAYSWIDIRSVGTPVNNATWTPTGTFVGQDEGVQAFPLPFTFNYYGTNYDSVYFSSNGFISTVRPTVNSFTNAAMPASATPNAIIAAFWDDLDLRKGGTVYYYNDAPNNQYIVQFDSIGRFSGAGNYFYEYILKSNGQIMFQYNNMTMGAGTLTSASVGIENSTGTVGLQMAFNAAYLHNSLAVLLKVRGVSWLSHDVTSGTIPPLGNRTIVNTFDATGLTANTMYSANVFVGSTNPDYGADEPTPTSLFVRALTGPGISVQPLSKNMGSVEVFTSKTDSSVTIRSIGDATLDVTSISSDNPRFTVTPSSASLPSGDSVKLHITFSPLALGAQSAHITILSNDPLNGSLQVNVSGTSFGVAHITATPDSLTFSVPSGPDTASQAVKVKNTGTDTLRYTVDEVSNTALAVRAQSSPPKAPAPDIWLPKDVMDTRHGDPVPYGSGGPDIFGYRWIDSDDPGGPTYSWMDISSVGTAITTWTSGTGDDGAVTVALPFAFPYYGVNQSSINIVTNGWQNFGAVSTEYLNAAIPVSATPNNAIYPWWDDLDVRTSGTVHYYYDTGNNRFIIQYTNVPHYSSSGTGTYTFQTILYPSGEIIVQYNDMQGLINSATLGIENSGGTDGLQVVFSANYVHNSLAILYTADLYPWLSTNVSSGTIAPGDSQMVSVRTHPGPTLPSGTYNGKIRIKGNSPDTARVKVRLDVTGGTPYVQVNSPNGGESYVVGQSYNITWTKNLVDTVKIEYSTNSGSTWILVKDGTPALAGSAPDVHPKQARNGKISQVSSAQEVGSYLWTVPNTPTSQARVRVSDKSNSSVNDISNADFSITSTPPSVWTSLTSGTATALNSVSIVDDQVAWTVGTAGIVLRTTNGGTTWTSLTALATDAHNVFALSANTALACVNPTAGNDGRIYRTTNGGAGWSLVYQNTGAGAFMDGVYMFDANNGIAVGDPVGAVWDIQSTANGGATWSPFGSLAQAGAEAGWNNSFEWSGTNGWFGTNNTRIYRTTNGGSSWASSATPSLNSYGVSFIDPSNGMSGDAAGVTAKSINGGSTWSAASAAGSGTAFPAGVAVPTPRWWATSGVNIYKTTNQGTSWALDHSRAATFNHIAMKVVDAANVIVGYAVGASGQISKYIEYLPVDNEPGSISGAKFNDLDGDSVWDAGEPGIAGWKIWLAGISDTTYTDSLGNYTFDSLDVGAYTVTEETRPGWVQTAPAGGTHSVSVASGENVTGKNFGNFELGSICGVKWKDVNGDGVKDDGEPLLSGWTINLSSAFHGSQNTTTDDSGHYCFTGLPADTFFVTEDVQPGWTKTYPPTAGHLIFMTSGLDTANLDFGNFYPDTGTYRSFTSDAIALSQDNKGKTGKIVKRKPDKVDFKFNLIVPSGPNTSTLALDFSMIASGTITRGKTKQDVIGVFNGKKVSLPLPVVPGDTVQVDGRGVKGKTIKVKYAFGAFKKAAVTAFKLNVPRTPMPNAINMVAELFDQGAFDATQGLVVGRVMSGIDVKRYGWVQIGKYGDVANSLNKKGTLHTGPARFFDLVGTKPFVGMKKSLPPAKHNNVLFAELLALRINIIASEAGKTPVGFGDLIYDDGAGGPFSGKTVIQICDQADSFITYGISPKPGVPADSFYHVIRAINSDFNGSLDTLSFGTGKLQWTGVKAVSASTILKPNPSAQPTRITLKAGSASYEPVAFNLYQNYPNPFNPATTIDFDLPDYGFVTLKVYDMLGREVATLLDHAYLDDGGHSVEFAAEHLSSGVYFYRMVAEIENTDFDADETGSQGATQTYTSIRKLLLMK